MKITSITAILAAILIAAPASSAPTQIPGGANQVSAISGKLGQTVWNGAVKLTLVQFRDATPEETKAFLPSAGQKVMYFEVRLQNGTHDEFTDLIEYTFADASEVAVQVPAGAVTHANLHILQGAAVIQKGTFAVDSDFAPVKMIARCVTCSSKSAFRAVRVALAR